MKRKVLIISPYFPPSNAADAQRIRMSLPYFKQYDWIAEVVTVKPEYSEMHKDDLLLQSVPQDVRIHYVKAFTKKWTSKIGLGSLALRSLWFYMKAVNTLLITQRFDLIYFSTTQFPVCILGSYWKKRFNIPFVIDMQDPWHSDYYKNKPKMQKPAKYWFSYRLNKYLEPLAMKHVDGLISVSEDYILTLIKRYPRLDTIPSSVITFGVLKEDFNIAMRNKNAFSSLLNPDKTNIVYIGRGGNDMHAAIIPLFEALKRGMELHPSVFEKLHFYFIGTSYAPQGQGKATILPLAEFYKVKRQVTEHIDRIGFYHALITMQNSDVLFVAGSDDPKYTASKIYLSLFAKKPLMAIFHDRSSVIEVIEKCSSNAVLIRFSETKNNETVYETMKDWANHVLLPITLKPSIEEYTAENRTKMQVTLFNQVISRP